MKKILGIILASIALLFVVAFVVSLFLPIRFKSPVVEVKRISDASFLEGMQGYYEHKALEDEQHSAKMPPFPSKNFKDYAILSLITETKNFSMLEKEVLGVYLTEPSLDDGIFVHKYGQEFGNSRYPGFYQDESDIIESIDICIKDMTNEQIVEYVHSLRFEMKLKTITGEQTVPISFEDAEVVFLG